MIEDVDVQTASNLAEYEEEVELVHAVRALREKAQTLVPHLRGRTVWMVNSTPQGGGVAEMLPRLVTSLRDLGVETRWVVIHPEDPRFFHFTKRLHNLLHGEGDPNISSDERQLYDETSDVLAQAFAARLAPHDLVVCHDPQPLGMAVRASQSVGAHTIWRCHVGLDETNAQTRAAWSFLRQDVTRCHQTVFTAKSYAPPFAREAAAIIPPAIDPFSHKNRELSIHKLTGVLCNAGLVHTPHPLLTSSFTAQALQLDDGTFRPVSEPGLGLMFRPIVSQISRWDRLKGFVPLVRGFVTLKQNAERHADDARDRRRLAIVRLVLAGPDASSVQDDPEAQGVLDELCALHQSLSPELQTDVVILQLPMTSPKENALMVNAIQRCSTVVAQNSLREGFGLTVTEAMWKRVAVMGTSASGIRQQLDDGVHGRRVEDPDDPKELAGVLGAMLSCPYDREHWASQAKKRVYEEFLVFVQVGRWLEVLSTCSDAPESASAAKD